jgi:multicomponent Na+:H+ antiporter subunit D
MGLNSNIYLLIFLPLVASLFCQIFSKKTFGFLIAIGTCAIMLFLELKIFWDVLVYEKISNDFELSVLSLALEFRLDILGVIFLLLLTFIKTVILFFYRGDIEDSLDRSEGNIFYSVFLLHLFSMVGIFTTNNLLNLFFFFEIYSFAFFATLSITKNVEFAKLSFRYFCLNSISSLLILFCVLAIYLTFHSVSFDNIASDLSLIPAKNSWFIAAIFIIMAFAIIIKFFPFWLYFEKLRNTSLISSFLSIESLFIKTGIGIFVTLKFVYFFFGNKLIFSNFNFAPILIFLSICLIFYSSIKLYAQKHLKMISAYLCLNNLGFIFACIAVQTIESLQALFFYLLNFTLVSLLIFIFATFLKRHFATSSSVKIWLVKKDNFILALPLQLLVFSIAAFPLTNLFFANWYLSYASFTIGFEAFLLFGIFISNFVYISQAVRIVSTFFTQNHQHDEDFKPVVIKNYRLYFISFWFLIIVIYGSIFAADLTNSISLKFASYLLSNTI